MTFVLAIDGGATKTAIAVCDHTGRIVFEAVSTGSNYQAIGTVQVEHVLTSLLHEVHAKTNITHIDAAVFAIAGIDTKTDQKVVQTIVQSSIAASPISIDTYVVENDVEATLRGLTKNNPAALLISGTGAIAFSYDGTSIYRAGGFGHRAGDEGSGYWIGQQVAKAIFKAFDGRGEHTRLTDIVLCEKNLADVDALMNWLYDADYTNARLASLGSYVQRAVEANDAVAITIAHAAAEELALLAKAVLTNASYTGGAYTFYLNGGVLKNNAAILEKLTNTLHKTFPNITFTLCDEKPLTHIIQRALHLL